VLATWNIRSGNWHIARDGINLLVEASEMRVQSTRLILLILVFQRLFSRRRGSIRALCLHLNQATGLFQLSRDPPPFFAVDQAIDDLTFAQNVCRCDQRKSRTACEKCPVTTPTDHSSATDQTTDLQEAGSAPLDCIGSLGYPFYNNALMMSTTAIFAYLSTERARFSTKLFPCLFCNRFLKEPAQGRSSLRISQPLFPQAANEAEKLDEQLVLG